MRRRWLFVAAGVALMLAALGGAAWLAAQSRHALLSGAAIKEALGRMSGHRLSVALTPEIAAFPSFGVTLRGVALHDWQDTGDANPLLTARRMTVTLSPWAALFGQAEIRTLTLEGVALVVGATGDQWRLPVGSGSRLFAAVALARLSRESNGALAMPEGSGLLPPTIRLSDGVIVARDADGTQTTLLDAIDLTLETPTLDRSISGVLTARWRGEMIAVEITVDDMMMALAGGETGLSATLKADGHAADFSGRGSFGTPPLISGDFTLDTRSVAQALAWQRIAAPYGGADAPLTLSGTVAVDGLKWQFSDLSGRFGTSDGRGALTVLPSEDPVSVAGTLDFDTLDLAAFAASLSVAGQAGGSLDTLPQQRQPLDLDLRISASRAELGDVVLRELAATTRARPDMVSVDINNAALFGGTTQVALKIDRTAEPARMELRLLAENLDTVALAAGGAPWFAGVSTRVALSAILNGPALAFSEFPQAAKGTLKLYAGSGTVSGLDFGAVISALAAGQSTPVQRASSGSLPFAEMLAEGELAQGTLTISKFRAGLPRATIRLGGTYTLGQDAIALSGAVSLEANHPAAGDGVARTLPFLISGTRDQAMIGPVQRPATQP
ncbi:MAG: AsmA family protein [Rhizobiaceae bacterium]|jgi:AsmA protein|nr:AsmA family protein [Rhizobiaceae bacterium]